MLFDAFMVFYFLLCLQYGLNVVNKKKKRTNLRRSHKSEMCLFHRSVATNEYFINTNHLEFSLFEINYLSLAKKWGRCGRHKCVKPSVILLCTKGSKYLTICF